MTEPVLPGLAVFVAVHQPGTRIYIKEEAWYAAANELVQSFVARLQGGVQLSPADWGSDGFLLLGRWVMRDRSGPPAAFLDYNRELP